MPRCAPILPSACWSRARRMGRRRPGTGRPSGGGNGTMRVVQRAARGGPGAPVETRTRPPKAAFWLMVGLTFAALAAVGADLLAAGAAPDPAWEARATEANAALVARFYAEVWNRGDF